MAEEKVLWEGTPSQVLNLPLFIVLGILSFVTLGIGLIVFIPIAFWMWLVIKNTKYELTNQRLKIRTGVINKKMDDMELYRVKDYKLNRPLYLRIFSLGNIHLKTSDRSNPNVKIRAIKGGEELRETIRHHVELRRDHKRVREVDFE